jgi:hypothetical protein
VKSAAIYLAFILVSSSLLPQRTSAAALSNVIHSLQVRGQTGPALANLIYGGSLSTPVYSLHMPHGTGITSLAPSIRLARGAAIRPASGTPRSFTRPLVPYVVTHGGRARTNFVRCVVLPPAAATRGPAYLMGTPVLQDIWVDPVRGSDAAGTGRTRARAYRTLARAWRDVPARTRLQTTGYRLLLCPGDYRSDLAYLEHRYGTYERPVILQAADGPGTAIIRYDLQLFSCNYVYLLDLVFEAANGGDGLHLDSCEVVLIRNCAIRGGPGTQRLGREGLKANQCAYLFVEDSDIANAQDNALDFMASHYGHVRRCRIRNAGDWAAYVKGGSSHFTIADNRISRAGTGGFVAGQGAGSEFLVAPWIRHEASDIQFVRNIIHDCDGAGFGANGGKNILFASNTLYRTGANSHGIELAFGLRSLDNAADAPIAQTYAQWGGWVHTRSAGEQRIPNQNVYIYNNILCNPPPYRSAWQHFQFQGPWRGNSNTNIPRPAVTDRNLRIRGNILWNGPPDLPLGIEEGTGCQPANPTCNATLLRRHNHINQFAPQLVDPARGDFRPLPGGNVSRATRYPIPPFPDDYESDNSRSTAKPIANGQTQDRTIHAAGNEDWARFTLTGRGARDLRLETAGPRGDTQLWLYDRHGRRLAYDDDSGPGRFSRITRAALPAGTYYLRVREHGNNGTLPAYTLRARWTPR